MQRLESLPKSPAQCPSHSLTSARWREDYLPKIQRPTIPSQQPIAYDTTNDVRRGKVYISILGNGTWELEES